MDAKAYKEKIKAEHYESNVLKGHIPPSIDNAHIRGRNKILIMLKKIIIFVKNFI